MYRKSINLRKIARNPYIRKILRKFGLVKAAGNDLTIFPNDIFLVSYPRSGNTWMRFLIGQARSKRALNFNSLELKVPDIYQNSDWEMVGAPRPRVLKSHELYDKRYPKIIYLVRDPRDVAISYYYWRKKTGTFEKRGVYPTLEEYLYYHFSDQEFNFIGWLDHVDSWLGNSSLLGDKLFVIRYEDLEKQPKKMLTKTIEFTGIKNIEDHWIDFSLRESRIKQMRRKEKALPTTEEDGIPFVRKGYSGQWKEVFDKDMNELFWVRFRRWMEPLGYKKNN